MINQRNLLVGSIVSITIIDQDVETIPLGPHINQQSDRVTNMNRSSNSISTKSVTRTNLHEALGRGQGEDDGVGGVGSVDTGEDVLVEVGIILIWTEEIRKLLIHALCT